MLVTDNELSVEAAPCSVVRAHRSMRFTEKGRSVAFTEAAEPHGCCECYVLRVDTASEAAALALAALYQVLLTTTASIIL